MKARCVFVLAGLVAALAMAARAERVVVKGSNTFGEELAPQLIAAFHRARPDITVELESKGSGSGIQALIDHGCDIAASSRAMSEDELRRARSRGVVLRNYTIGYYGIAVVVHPSNTVSALTDGQVRDVFTGAVTNWSALGGPDAAIRVAIRGPVSGTYLGFQELAMDGRPYPAAAERFTDYQQIAEVVARDPHAIGYVGMSLAARHAVRAVTINRIAPTPAAVMDQSYPYARQLRLYADKKQLTDAARDFIQFVRSRNGQAILDALGFVQRYQVRLPFDDNTP